MKHLTILMIAIIISANIFAQAPQQFSYQAIVRDVAGDPVINTNIGLQLSIHESTATGTIAYRERFTIASNEFGLVNLNIGTGTVMEGSMNGIDWVSTSHFLQVEQDLTGGTTYTNLGATQLLSVPYALHAETVNLQLDNTLEGEGTLADPLKIAQQAANPGDILEWNGTTWIPGNVDCTTLDEGYDCGAPGGGRFIAADSGPVLITTSAGSRGLQINNMVSDLSIPASSIYNIGSAIGEYIEIGGPDGIGEWVSTTSTEEGILIQQHGTGIGLRVNSTMMGNPSPLVLAINEGTANAGRFVQSNAMAVGAASLFVEHEGLGMGTEILTSNPMNPTPVLKASSLGLNTIGKFDGINAASVAPVVDITNLTGAHSIYIGSSKPVNPNEAVKIFSTNIGGAMSAEGTHPATVTMSTFEYTNMGVVAPGTGSVASFSQIVDGAAVPKPAVEITTTSIFSPALKVASPGPTGAFAAEFIGDVDITDDLVVDGTSELNDDVIVTGDLDVTGLIDAGSVSAAVKMFKIDHPLDPENKYLQHACVESYEMLNIYTGNVVLDANGEAIVTMPDWFNALNTDCRYQLTCIGGFANVFIKEKMNDGQFVIAGGLQGLEISWQLTAVRKDKWALENPLQVEKQKVQVR